MEDINAELDFFKGTPIATFLPSLDWNPTGRKGEFERDGSKIETFLGRGDVWRFKDEEKRFGTIIDLVQDQIGRGKLGDTRRILRAILGSAEPTSFIPTSGTPTPPITPALEPHQSLPTKSLQSSPVLKSLATIEEAKKLSHAEALAAYEDGSELWDDSEETPQRLHLRGIHWISRLHSRSFRISTRSQSLRFPYLVRLDSGEIQHGAHETVRAGLHGDDKQYVKGGLNGFWMSSGPRVKGKTAVVFESPIDALSYDEMHHCPEGRHLFALRSGSEVMCIDAIRDMIDLGLINMVIIATDNDPAGMTYAGKALTRLQAGRDKEAVGPARKYYGGVRAYYHAPDKFFEDWNDVSRNLDTGISP